MGQLNIRVARVQDAKELLEIYAPYVEKTAVSFEYEVPTVEEFEGRIAAVLQKYPYLVAEREGEILGYAYAGSFKGRAAYDWAVETSIYIRKDQKREGIGRALYEALERALALQNILNLNAAITSGDQEDEYFTRDSIRFHERMGYRLVGEFRQCGYKFGRWYHVVWMEKHLGGHLEHPLLPRAFDEVKELFSAQ